MSMRSIPIVLAVLSIAACTSSESPRSVEPMSLQIVSGSNQTGSVSTALSAPLVVGVYAKGSTPVSGVSIAWTVVGGGSVSPTTSTTNAQGQASTNWTLGPTPGIQTVTATAASIVGAAVSFVAGNGPTITGTVTETNPDPTTFFSAARVRTRAAGAARRLSGPRYSRNGIEVTFHNAMFHAAQAGSPVYRSMTVARSTALTLRQHLVALTQRLPVRDLRVSPAILAAHLTVTDPSEVDSVMAVLRADPSVATVSRDLIRSIPQGAPAAQAAHFPLLPRLSNAAAHTSGVATRLPNDPFYPFQSWSLNVTDVPRAWALTTGSQSFSVADVDMGVRFDDPSMAGAFTTDSGYDFVSQTTLASLGYDSVGVYCVSGSTFTTIDGNGPPHANATDPDDIFLDSSGTCWEHNPLGDHGQWTSGIIAAPGNDGDGTTGVEWNGKIRPIRVLGITGDGTAFDIAQGILYAAGLPAVGANDSLVTAPSKSPIINLSLGGYGSDPTDSAATEAAIQAGCLVIASAGNGTTDQPVYPAAYPGVLGVAAVGMDGVIASYSNGGSYVSLAAPGGEFRLDDNGGDGVLGPGFDFTADQPTFLFGYGTSAAAPYVSGVAALVLATTPGLSASSIAQRLEQYASRPPNSTRNDNYGWGIVDAYDALTQTYGPPRNSYVRLIDALTGTVVQNVEAAADGQFTLAQLSPGSYLLQAGEDESGDATIGIPGRRLGWAGPASNPTVFTVTSSSIVQNAGIAIGVPLESEPNDSRATANPLSVNSYVVGQIYAPDTADYYKVQIPAAGTYTFQTSGVTGACGWGIELDTKLTLSNASGGTVASNDDSGTFTGPNCSLITTALSPGTYYVEVTGSTASQLASQGRYRLQVSGN